MDSKACIELCVIPDNRVMNYILPELFSSLFPFVPSQVSWGNKLIKIFSNYRPFLLPWYIIISDILPSPKLLPEFPYISIDGSVLPVIHTVIQTVQLRLNQDSKFLLLLCHGYAKVLFIFIITSHIYLMNPIIFLPWFIVVTLHIYGCRFTCYIFSYQKDSSEDSLLWV